MKEFSEELVKGYLSGILPILMGLFVFVLLIIAVKFGISWIASLVKERLRDHASDNKHQKIIRRERWMQEIARQKREAEGEEAKTIAKWRRLYNLSEEAPLFKVTGTELYMPYPVEITDAENDLLVELETHFRKSCIMPDCYFENVKHKTVQIDSIAINEKGVFIFESKDYAGWIFGNGNYTKWTQILAYGKRKNYFYNPIKQNAGHVATVRRIIGDNIKIYSVIVFSNRGELRDIDVVPKATYVCSLWRLAEVISDIESTAELSQSQIMEIRKKLQRACIRPNENVRNKHVEEIRDELGTDRVYK